MKEAEHHNSFFFAHKKIKNLKELLEALEDPQYSETAKSHVNEEKNDYANWIKDVLNENELAEKISKEKDIQKIASLIKERITIESGFTDLSELKLNDEHSEIVPVNPETPKYDEAKKENEKEKKDLHLEKETLNHKAHLKNSTESRHFCPRFFECMKKEFLFGFLLGIIVGIVLAIFIKVGAI
jgi:hypothetical protein